MDKFTVHSSVGKSLTLPTHIRQIREKRSSLFSAASVQKTIYLSMMVRRNKLECFRPQLFRLF